MAVAAYASVLSLMLTVENALHPLHSRLLPNIALIRTLQENLGLLQDVLEKLPSKINEEIEELARRIPEITNEADDIIDNYMVDRKIGSFGDGGHDVDMMSSSFCQNLDGIVQKIGSIKRKLTMMLEDHKIGLSHQNPTNFRVRTSSSSSEAAGVSDKTGTVVGFKKPLLEIMERLISRKPDLQVIPILGMGGIGKTTLARYAFDNKCIVENFTIRIWLTISRDYDVGTILEGLLNDGVIGDNKNKANVKDAGELGLQLYQKLFGRKYLIVMDDVWSVQAWDDLRPFFPNNLNGSRIVATSRLSVIANAMGSKNSYKMDFLVEDDSWVLFSERAFTRCGRSPELEETGKKIAKNCRGLPLALVVIGGLLANSDISRAYWELVAENVSSFANSENDENCLKILSLSYDYMPIHLKPCFLYMTVFRDQNILVSDLIRLWIAEGFVKPVRDKTLEEAALENLKDLIDRNLIGIRGRGSGGNITKFGIHDLLRDLGVREYYKEHSLSVPRIQQAISYKHLEGCCFLCGNNIIFNKNVHLSEVNLFCLPSKSVVRPLVCDTCRNKYPKLIRLRCVTLIGTAEGEPIEFQQTTKSRLFQISTGYIKFVNPSSINLLWNLQSLNIMAYIKGGPFPFSEIWGMPQLRHLKVRQEQFHDPPVTDDITILENFQTLNSVLNFRCTEEVVDIIPNMRKLGLSYDISSMVEVSNLSYYCLHNLHLLQRLESIFIKCHGFTLDMENITFPHSLKKLCLLGCKISWKDINDRVGVLPNLEVLKLKRKSVVEDEWNLIEGRFSRLKYMGMWELNLMRWDADERHFPVLETLVLGWVHELENFPSSIGDINTLQSIKLYDVKESVMETAKEMIEEQQSNGNETLRLYIWDDGTSYQYGGAS